MKDKDDLDVNECRYLNISKTVSIREYIYLIISWIVWDKDGVIVEVAMQQSK